MQSTVLDSENGFTGEESDDEPQLPNNLLFAPVEDGEEEEDEVYRDQHGLTLEEIQRELLELAELSDAGYDIDEKRFDFLLKAQEENPEYQAMLEEERANWRESLAEFLEQCLERTRTFIPVNIFDCKTEDLLETGLSDELARRLQQRQCLWLVRMGKDEIARLHESDLLGRFNSQQQHLDIIETAAVYASLPDEFKVDPSGRKRDWKLTIEDNLRQMLLDNDQDALPIEKIRNPAYEGRQYGPIDDVTSVRAVKVHKASDARKSFLQICKEHSIIGRMRALSRRRSKSTEHNSLAEVEGESSPTPVSVEENSEDAPAKVEEVDNSSNEVEGEPSVESTPHEEEEPVDHLENTETQ
jgi:hypothetical protein